MSAAGLLTLSAKSVAGWIGFGVKWMFLTLVACFLLNQSAIHKEADFLTPKDELYDIGFDQKLYMKCVGEGQPTIVLDAPTGMSSDVWWKLQELLAESTTVCTYDRAGIGFSEPPRRFNMSDPGEVAVARSKGPEHTTLRMINDLRALLITAIMKKQISAPFVLVGSEVGAVNALAYSRAYPEQVDQVVMLDPVSSKLFEDEKWSADFDRVKLPSLGGLVAAGSLGLARAAMLASESMRPQIARMGDEGVASRQMHFYTKFTHLYSLLYEHVRLNESCVQLDRMFSEPAVRPELVAEVRTALVTGNYYDETAENAVNRAWSQSASYVMAGAGSQCQHSVFNGSDGRHFYRKPNELADYLKNIVRRFRKRSKMTKSM